MPSYLSVVEVIYNPMIVSIFINPTAPPTCSSYDFLTETGGQQKPRAKLGAPWKLFCSMVIMLPILYNALRERDDAFIALVPLGHPASAWPKEFGLAMRGVLAVLAVLARVSR